MNSKVKVVEPAGIFDTTKADEFRQTIEALLAEGVDIILIDLKNVTFIDSSGLGMLVVLLKRIRACNSQLYICSINDQVRMLFELTGMDRVFSLLADQQDFETRVLKQA